MRVHRRTGSERLIALLGLTLLIASAAGCRSASSEPAAVLLHGQVSAGPVCPVVPASPDPACADRPVAGAILVVVDAAGDEVTRAVSGTDGRYEVRLAPGSYQLIAQPVDGLMGTPGPVPLEVRPDDGSLELNVGYDTGMR